MADATALEFLQQFTNYEQVAIASSSALQLERMQALLAALDHPERRWPALHVAGTKGKGSTCAILASVLRAAGARVGLYTSPHLVSLRERIQPDGRWVTDAELAGAVEAVRPAVAGLTSPPTYFEVLTAMAFWLFARWAVDVAVVEVGLGGRLDATNVIDPLVSVITPISFDHVAVLGSTLGQIAGEKAGIIKPGRPIVMAPQPPDARAVVEQAARLQRSRLVEVGAEIRVQRTGISPDGQDLIVTTRRHRYSPLHFPLLGAHQTINLATAVAALEQLPSEWRVSPSAVAAGVAGTHWPGRLQVAERHPWLVLDGAQNAASAEALQRAVAELWPGRRIHLVLGISSDKDLDGVISALHLLAPATVVATQADTPRALPAGALATRLRQRFPSVRAVPHVEEAIEAARRAAAADDVILVTGSFYVLGEYLRAAQLVSHG